MIIMSLVVFKKNSLKLLISEQETTYQKQRMIIPNIRNNSFTLRVYLIVIIDKK